MARKTTSSESKTAKLSVLETVREAEGAEVDAAIEVEVGQSAELVGDGSGKALPPVENDLNNAPAEYVGAFVYIGASLLGVVANGTIFTCTTKSSIAADISARAEARGLGAYMTDILRLTVRVSDFAASKSKLKAGGNALSAAYERISAIFKDEVML